MSETGSTVSKSSGQRTFDDGERESLGQVEDVQDFVGLVDGLLLGTGQLLAHLRRHRAPTAALAASAPELVDFDGRVVNADALQVVHAHQLVELGLVVDYCLQLVHVHEDLVDVPVQRKDVEQHFVLHPRVDFAHQKGVESPLRVVHLDLLQRNKGLFAQRLEQRAGESLLLGKAELVALLRGGLRGLLEALQSRAGARGLRAPSVRKAAEASLGVAIAWVESKSAAGKPNPGSDISSGHFKLFPKRL